MKCKKCESSMELKDVSVKIAAHDPRLLDVIITCPYCGHQINDFINTEEIVDLYE